ncbi:MAG: hypothetical protein JWP11_3164 [Frankiales bacterium]|nr:hypothetical protein [Frankiales bacterium]
MVRTGSHDIGPDDSGGGRLYGPDGGDAEQDPVAALHDTEEESGDEIGLVDTYRIDGVEAAQMGVALDRAGGQEAELD